MVVTGIAFGVSEGKKHFDLLQRESFRLFYDRPFVYDYQWYGLQMEIALVDAASNKVIWYNYNDERDSNYNPLEKERVKDLCLKLLKAK